MTLQNATPRSIVEDPVGNVLKWVLLAVAVVTFGLLGWATTRTYALAPPIPARFLAPDGTAVLTAGAAPPRADVGALPQELPEEVG